MKMKKETKYRLSNFNKNKFKVEALYDRKVIGETSGILKGKEVIFEFPIINANNKKIGGFVFNSEEDEKYRETVRIIERED